jgi:2-hydroxy-3-oxopropionate reductase
VKATVGVVGIGLLDHAIASRLLAAGHDVVGYDVVPEKVEVLAALGGKPAPSAKAVARAAEVVCTLLLSLATVEAAILGSQGVAAGARAGHTLVQMSTISPALTERLARGAGDYRGRGYWCRDPEGHLWNFGTYDPWAERQA